MATEGPGPGLQLQAGLQPELRALPGLLRALGMLAMTHAEVQLATERALADNPVLERAEGHPCPGCGRHVASGTCFRCRGQSGVSQFRDGPSRPSIRSHRWKQTQALKSARTAGTRWTSCWLI